MTKDIKEKIKSLIDNEIIKDTKYHEEWVSRNLAWKEKKEQLRQLMEKVVTLKGKNKQRGIYIQYLNNETFIRLATGAMPIGNQLNNPNAIEAEDGAELVFSKSVDGTVLCIVYPCKSKQMRPIEDYVIYKIYKSANAITEKEIYKAIRFFFIYSRITSAASDATEWEKTYCWYIKIKGRFFTWLFKKVMPSLIKTGITD